MKKMKVTKGLVASAVVLIPLSSVSMAFASTSFDTQYQSNVSEETSLLQTAQSSSVSNPQIVALSNAVQTINTQVSALYQSEQTLANQEADMTQVNTSNDQSLQQLQQQRDQILQQSQSAWDQVNRFKNNRSSFGRRSFEHSRQDWLTIGQQLNLIDNQIRSFHDRGNQFSYHSSYNGAVSALQSSILKLQDTSIQYTNEWINLEQTETGTSGGSVGSGTLPIPIVTMNTSYYGLVTLTISNATPDATVNLYTSFGQEVSSTTADSNGNASFDNLPSGSYYVVQTYDGQQSAQSNTVTYTAQSTVATPSLVVNDNNGLAEVDVSNAAPDATVNLYSSSGQEVSSTTADSYGNASFDNLPSGSYYVVQIYDGQQSAPSNTVTFSDQSTLATPSLAVMDTNGVEDLGVSNATPDATVNLFTSSGQVVSATTADSNGNASFDNLSSGSYYVVQTYDGQQSAQSNTVTFSDQSTLATPSLTVMDTNGVEDLAVSNATPDATVNLFTSSGQVVSATTADSNGNASFDNLSSGSYYVVQTYDGQQSAQSNTVTYTAQSTVATPSLVVNDNNGLAEVDVSNAAPDATVNLYSSSGQEVSSTTADSYGNASFDNLPSGSYYVVQIYDGQQSAPSNTVTFSDQSTLATPSLAVMDTNGVEDLAVSNATPDATVNLFTSSGQVVSATTADSNGNASFDNLSSGSYYVVQTYDGQQSAQSNTVTFSDQSTLATPSLAVMDTNGVEDLAVSNATPDATVNLYSSSGQDMGSTAVDSNGNASFDNLPSGSYYVVQTYDGQQSAQSNTVTFTA